MKKLLVAFVAVVAVSFASCGGNTQAAGNNDSDSLAVVTEETVELDTVDGDTLANDTIAE